MNGLMKLTRNELKLLWREPLTIFFSVAFPALLVVILGSIPGFREPAASIGGRRFIDLYVPIAAVAILVAVGRVAFDVQVPKQLVGFALAIVLCSAALFAIGLTIAAVL